MRLAFTERAGRLQVRLSLGWLVVLGTAVGGDSSALCEPVDQPGPFTAREPCRETRTRFGLPLASFRP